jgi:hypothetical protein
MKEMAHMEMWDTRAGGRGGGGGGGGGGGLECILAFSQKIWREETTWKIQV